MSDYKIPWDELSGESNLKGTYKVTFLVDITEDDQMSIEDLHQALASSVSGDPVLNKISHLDLEKTTKEGQAIPLAVYKVGDEIIITEDVQIEAKLTEHEGNYIVGSKTLGTEQAGEGILIVPAGSRARINKIEGDQVELVDFQDAMSASVQNSETNEINDVLTNVDSVILSNKYIAHVTKEDDENLWL